MEDQLRNYFDIRNSVEEQMFQKFVTNLIGSFKELLQEQRDYEAQAASSPESPGTTNSDSEPETSDAKRLKLNGSQDGFESPNPFSVLESENMEENSESNDTPPVTDTPPGQTLASQLANKRAIQKNERNRKKATANNQVPLTDKNTPGPLTQASTSATQAADSDDPKPRERRVPTITIHEKDKWLNVSSGIRAANIQFTKAESRFDGIHVHPATTTDHRNLSKWLAQQRIAHHVYSLPQDKPIRIVIRGLPHGLPCDEIKAELLRLGFPVLDISKLKSGGPDRRESHLVYVLLKKCPEAEAIYDLTDLLYLKVKIESKRRPRNKTRQCYNCQLFGHTASSCHAAPRCVKCAGVHETRECRMAQEDKPKCINCSRAGRSGEHVASDRHCPLHPVAAERRRSASASRTRLQYSQVVKATQPTQQPLSQAAQTYSAVASVQPLSLAAQTSAPEPTLPPKRKRGTTTQAASAANTRAASAANTQTTAPTQGCNLMSTEVWNAFRQLLSNLLAAQSPADALAILQRSPTLNST